MENNELTMIPVGQAETIRTDKKGRIVERTPAGSLMMMPAAPGTCPECAVAHEPNQPHNNQSLFYQMKFHAANGRFPTWADAMAHCSPEVQEFWRSELEKRGVKVDGQ